MEVCGLYMLKKSGSSISCAFSGSCIIQDGKTEEGLKGIQKVFGLIKSKIQAGTWSHNHTIRCCTVPYHKPKYHPE